MLGARPAALLGRDIVEVLGGERSLQLRQQVENEPPLLRPVHICTMLAPRGGALLDVIAHRNSQGSIIVEFERHDGPQPDDAMAAVQMMIRGLQRAEDTGQLCRAAASVVRGITGYDRVMVYQFLPDGSGAVVAEARDPQADSFLGLHYPPSDIPAQARALYLANWIRTIPDSRYAPMKLVSARGRRTGPALDLSHAVSRSVSPIHRQYLVNMGVAASLSLSLVVQGQLWGLIACHHSVPRFVPHRLRFTCELFAEVASAQLEIRSSAAHFAARVLSTRVHEALVLRMSQSADLASALLGARADLLDFIPAGGVVLWSEGKFHGFGTTPSMAQVRALVGWLAETRHDGVFHTDCLARLYPPARAYAAIASGVLALAVSRTPQDYALWFRPEQVSTVDWAGDPAKQGVRMPEGEVLTPRKSFAVWREVVHDHAAPWLETEIEAAHRLRVSILEVVLRQMDLLAREREASRVKQAKLSRALDLRVTQWQSTARALRRESERRAVVEAELGEVLRQTVSDQENLRKRIARELHDTLGQSLTLLQLGIEGLAKTASEGQEPKLAAVKRLAMEAAHDVHRLAWEVRPSVLDDLGIGRAIRALLESWSEGSGLEFDLELPGQERRLPPEVETTLYRVLQEALTNVVRHARASRVGVILSYTDQQAAMIVEDDGMGLGQGGTQAEGSASNRLGLLGIRERLALVGGTLEVEGHAGSGTTLFVRIAL
jgi:light-regulated signal transduction histidine kinase (bacteriophytochrome)